MTGKVAGSKIYINVLMKNGKTEKSRKKRKFVSRLIEKKIVGNACMSVAYFILQFVVISGQEEPKVIYCWLNYILLSFTVIFAIEFFGFFFLF